LTEVERQLDELKEEKERLHHALQASEKKYQASFMIYNNSSSSSSSNTISGEVLIVTSAQLRLCAGKY